MTSPWTLAWRNARRGTAHPEQVTSEYWSWLITSETSSWAANRDAKGPSSMIAGPAWSFERFGMASVELPDGRTLHIAGEHEDHYDPDFFIYNDVIVAHPDGSHTFWLYPTEVFPPTDFHAAVLLGDHIVLIGCLGYPADRRPGTTPVLLLHIHTGEIRAVHTEGEGPGWIYRHDAELLDGRIVLTGGKIHGEARTVENIDEWALDPDTWTWSRLSERRWPAFAVCRDDGKRNELWEMRQWLWNAEHPGFESSVTYPEPSDPEALKTLYSGAEQDPESFDVYRREVNGVTVRYVERSQEVEMTVEGTLPPDEVGHLVTDLVDRLTHLLQTPCSATQTRD